FIHDYSEGWDVFEPGFNVKATYELGEKLKEMEAIGFWLFGLRTIKKTKLPSRDGNDTPFDMNVANFHFAYSDSDQILVVDSERK
ncbi:MAG TPA: hypothetical protein VIE69_02395, partial [Methylophilaceae bacterium]